MNSRISCDLINREIINVCTCISARVQMFEMKMIELSNFSFPFRLSKSRISILIFNPLNSSIWFQCYRVLVFILSWIRQIDGKNLMFSIYYYYYYYYILFLKCDNFHFTRIICITFVANLYYRLQRDIRVQRVKRYCCWVNRAELANWRPPTFLIASTIPSTALAIRKVGAKARGPPVNQP